MVLVATSCTDSATTPGPTTPGPTVCYIATEPGITYVYNEKNQVTSINSGFLEVTYHSNGLPDKMFGLGGFIARTYEYDADNRLTRLMSPGDTTEFTYNSSGQLLTETHLDGDGGVYFSAYTYPNTSTHNYSSATGSEGVLTSTTSFLYDDKKNPYNSAPSIYFRQSIHIHNSIYRPYASNLADNNQISLTYSNYSANYTSTTTYTYSYNDLGYPVAVTRHDSFVSKFAYTYYCK